MRLKWYDVVNLLLWIGGVSFVVSYMAVEFTIGKDLSGYRWMPPLIGAVVGAGIGAWEGLRRIRAQHGVPPGFCRNCGYNLTGNVSGVCPECGEKI